VSDSTSSLPTLEQQHMRQALTERMLAALPQQHDQPEINDFYRHIRDYPERGGKGLRGQLILLSAALHGAKWQDALEVAAALELFQNWVLIHDDIEDDSEERRGKPAMHLQIGMPLALNVGDALHVYMWQLLHAQTHLPRYQDILHTFGWMIQRTAEGQHLDLSWVSQGRFDVSEDEYLEMVTRKTAYYTVVAPLQLGALCAGITPDERIVDAGKALGVAFQIRDDVLNLMPDISYGKEFAGDLYEAKRTLILAHTFAGCTSEEHDELCARLAKARSAKTDEDIAAMLDLIEKYGSLEHAQHVAERYAETGLQQLRDITQHLPNQDAAAVLFNLVESLASRLT
jgi:geranylgeranyl diphosphate synthase type II